jgi:hypothetical protein
MSTIDQIKQFGAGKTNHPPQSSGFYVGFIPPVTSGKPDE